MLVAGTGGPARRSPWLSALAPRKPWCSTSSATSTSVSPAPPQTTAIYPSASPPIKDSHSARPRSLPMVPIRDPGAAWPDHRHRTQRRNRHRLSCRLRSCPGHLGNPVGPAGSLHRSRRDVVGADPVSLPTHASGSRRRRTGHRGMRRRRHRCLAGRRRRRQLQQHESRHLRRPGSQRRSGHADQCHQHRRVRRPSANRGESPQSTSISAGSATTTRAAATRLTASSSRPFRTAARYKSNFTFRRPLPVQHASLEAT